MSERAGTELLVVNYLELMLKQRKDGVGIHSNSIGYYIQDFPSPISDLLFLRLLKKKIKQKGELNNNNLH